MVGGSTRISGQTTTGLLDRPPGARRRAVVLVGNAAWPYSRALRIGRALDGLGYGVEIAAVAEADVPDHEMVGPIAYRRYRASGVFASLTAGYRRRAPGKPIDPTAPMPVRVARAMAGRWRKARYLFIRYVFFPHTVRGWWRTLARELPPADVYHACGSLTLAAALDARRRDRRAGRRSVVIYDAIDLVTESNNVLDVPEIVRRWLAWRERRWARQADAITTVNDALAARIGTRFGGTTGPTIVPNYPERMPPADVQPDRIRAQLGLDRSTAVVLFQGRLGPNLGLDNSAEAILHVPESVLVLMGFGRGYAASLARDQDPRWTGRHFTIPSQHPDELIDWTASADVALVPLPAISYNQRHATPNKFFEAIVAGTPVVLGPDLPVMEAIVRSADLGVVARSLAPADLAAAIRSILDRSPDERRAWRARIAAYGRTNFTWPIAAERYQELVRRIDVQRGLAS
jgi:glycosyltransferase involved in cell wall biosynthesis